MTIFLIEFRPADLVHGKCPEILLKLCRDRGNGLHESVCIFLRKPGLFSAFLLLFGSIFRQTPQKSSCHKCHPGLARKLGGSIMLQTGTKALHRLHDLMDGCRSGMKKLFLFFSDFFQFF